MANPHAAAILAQRQKSQQSNTKQQSSNQSNKENTNMAQHPSNPAKSTSTKPSTPPPAPPTAAKPTNGAAATAAAPKAKRATVRLRSAHNPKMWVLTYADLIAEFGVPTDQWGKPMVVKKLTGLSTEEKEARAKAKAAEKAKFDSMSDAEKLALTKAKREMSKKSREAKKNAERDALIASIKAEIAAGKL